MRTFTILEETIPIDIHYKKRTGILAVRILAVICVWKVAQVPVIVQLYFNVGSIRGPFSLHRGTASPGWIDMYILAISSWFQWHLSRRSFNDTKLLILGSRGGRMLGETVRTRGMVRASILMPFPGIARVQLTMAVLTALYRDTSFNLGRICRCGFDKCLNSPSSKFRRVKGPLELRRRTSLLAALGAV
jgi:hypothetical protein